MLCKFFQVSCSFRKNQSVVGNLVELWSSLTSSTGALARFSCVFDKFTPVNTDTFYMSDFAGLCKNGSVSPLTLWVRNVYSRRVYSFSSFDGGKTGFHESICLRFSCRVGFIHVHTVLVHDRESFMQNVWKMFRFFETYFLRSHSIRLCYFSGSTSHLGWSKSWLERYGLACFRIQIRVFCCEILFYG